MRFTLFTVTMAVRVYAQLSEKTKLKGFGGRVMFAEVNYDKDAKGESILRALLKK
ncbi:MAG: hypothetical protein LUI87_08495 [Lachnospiraceae bacterium]|nr:hypothetical protein [Lachnospiraceae bacterium]